MIKKNLQHQDYKDTLINNKQIYKMKTIRSINYHQLGIKISLSCFDNETYIHDNGQASYEYGYYKIYAPSLLFPYIPINIMENM